MKDENDKLKAGELPADFTEGAEPLTKPADDEQRWGIDRDMMKKAYERAMTPLKAENIITAGHYKLDRWTGGLRRGFVWVWGADTSWGKSSHAILAMDENLKKGHNVVLISWEDAEELYADRILARRARINAKRFQRRLASSEEASRMAGVANRAEGKPIFLYAAGRPVEWVKEQLLKMSKKIQIDLVLVDYLQAADNAETGKIKMDRRNQVTYIARTMTDTIKRMGAAGIIYSQITVQPGTKKIPDRSSIKESRDVPNAAEVVVLGYILDSEGKIYDPETSDGQHLKKWLFLDKNKAGRPKMKLEMPWNDELASFDYKQDPTDYGEDWLGEMKL